jgi:hypothetical protein
LQRRAERDYFQKAIGLPAGEVYVSPIELTRGNSEAKTPLFAATYGAAAPDRLPN